MPSGNAGPGGCRPALADELRHRGERETTLALMRLLNDREDTQGLIRELAALLRKWTGCAAVGVRLREGDDFPYYELSGFPDSFSQVEPGLCRGDSSAAGNPSEAGTLLPCLCGNVLRGGLDTSLPFVTARGSFWSNGTTDFCKALPETLRSAWACARCTVKGFESAAYIPIRHAGRTLGLLQLNDRSAGLFTPELLEFLEGIADQIAIALAQRAAQSALEASEAGARRLAQALSQAGDGVIITSADDTIEYVNPAFERMTGFSAGDALGRSSREVCGVSLPERSRQQPSLDPGQEGAWAGRMVCRRRDGTPYIEETTISPVLTDAGRVEHYVAVKRDVSRDIELEEQQRQVQRLESIGRLAGGMAHDLNNLLTPILGYSEMLLATLEPESRPHMQVREIRKAAERSRDLVRQLLAYSRCQVLALRLVDLTEAVRAMEPLVRRMLREGIQLCIDIADEGPPVRLDRGLMEQVLANLVDNAQNAMPEGGTLRIVTRPARQDEIEALRRAGISIPSPMILRVCDTGRGMSEEVKQHIFEPFFTTKGDRGAGLGLAMVWGIVKQHRGGVLVDSASGTGTWVTVFLPGQVRTPAPEREATAPRPCAARPPGRSPPR